MLVVLVSQHLQTHPTTHQQAGGCKTQRGREAAAYLSCLCRVVVVVLVVGGGGGKGVVLAVQGGEREGLRELGVYTCRGQNQSLQDVRQGHDARDTGVLIHHHQPVHLEDGQGHRDERWTEDKYKSAGAVCPWRKR